jgi:hypothetical protein
MSFYPSVNVGTNKVSSFGDGHTINVSWYQAALSDLTKKMAYHIYYSTIKEDVFYEGVKYVSIDNKIEANLINLIPGQLYFIAVRPVEYNPTIFDLNTLPIAYDNLRYYPSSILSANISATDLTIPLLDTSDFLPSGFVKIGAELVKYTGVNYINNELIVPAAGSGTPSTLINQGDGYYTRKDGYIGDGYISGLTLLDLNAIEQTWEIRCSFVQRDIYNNPIAGTAKFIAIGSISGTSLIDGYSDPIIWVSNGYIVSNQIFSFSIFDSNIIFREGDGFIIMIAGSLPGEPGGRGFTNTIATLHTISGFDGYKMWNPTVFTFSSGESNIFDRIYVCQSRFEYPNFPYNETDGYHQVVKDLLSTDLSAADASNVDFPMYDFAGYHRTDPVQLLNGTCVGSYIGGEMGCIDGNGNVHILRGFSLQDQNTQRQDILLSVTGKPAVLIKRAQTGITCACYLASSEHPDDRCPICLGSKFVTKYEQYFNPRSSDGRILVRPGPTEENLKRYEAGMESEFPLDLWTLTVPTIKTRDIIVLFDEDDNEEFRYEVAGVTRNNTIVGLNGGQHFKVIRIRKFDPAYQIRIFRNTSKFPSKLDTSIAVVPGILPHKHEVVTNENIVSVNQINQITSISQAHSHTVVNGIIQSVLGHTHQIIMI